MSFDPQRKQQFSPGQKQQKDESYCSVARAMIDAHYSGTEEPDITPEVRAKFGAHMLDCLQCQQHHAAIDDTKEQQGQNV